MTIPTVNSLAGGSADAPALSREAARIVIPDHLDEPFMLFSGRVFPGKTVAPAETAELDKALFGDGRGARLPFVIDEPLKRQIGRFRLEIGREQSGHPFLMIDHRRIADGASPDVTTRKLALNSLASAPNNSLAPDRAEHRRYAHLPLS